MTSWRDIIKIHPACKLFPLMSPEELRELGEDIRANELTSPIVLWRDSEGNVLLLDGRNRLDAMEMVGLTITLGKHDELLCDAFNDLPQRDISGSIDAVDPYDFVISANVRRRHLSAQQKGDLIAAVLKAKPERSDRAIARDLHTSHPTVAAKRAELETTGRLLPVEKRTGLDGKARKPPKQTLRVKVTSSQIPVGAPILCSESTLTLPAPSFHVPAASWPATAPGPEPAPVPAEPALDVVKRLVRELPIDELEAFKHWFREFTGRALEPAQPKRSRGRPRKDGTPAQPRKPKDPATPLLPFDRAGN
jgi:hypothetical protein